ncbi:MAG: hypothetical protein HY074_00490 [Deltaproteobacteria bacterium]|nr:hypothetical protein [Deltaproteobacteria bacterium]
MAARSEGPGGQSTIFRAPPEAGEYFTQSVTTHRETRTREITYTHAEGARTTQIRFLYDTP